MWHSLVPIWTVILGVGVFLYVALDGFDLGVGMLHGFVKPDERETVMASIAPFWDGSETWLILGRSGCSPLFPSRRHHPGGRLSGHAGAAGAGVSRRPLRVPLQADSSSSVLGLSLLWRH